MLKIKDNVDLKELEKFGFEEFSNIYYSEATSIDKKYRFVMTSNLDLVYDLIQAGLIEKVGGESE